MTLREYFLERLNAERPYFVRMLQALPPDKLDYKPHERSPSAHELAWTLAAEIDACLKVAKEFQTEWNSAPPPAIAGIIEQFERASAQLAEQIAKMDEASWDRKAQFLYEGKVVMEKPAGEFLWYILFDAIHHRGQLSAYIRPMGGKVPAIYGPSADEQGGMM